MESADWQAALARAIRDPRQLLQRLGLRPAQLHRLDLSPAFPLRVTEHFVSLMRRGDPDDPLLRQVLPVTDEGQAVPGFVQDPVGDQAAKQPGGLLVKYAGRALLVTTGSCAIHCRYCFRRHFPYAEDGMTRGDIAQLTTQLAQQRGLREVILSGGDPLMLTDTRLDALITQIEARPEVQRLRLHSRLPVVLPARLTTALCRRLVASRLQVVLVLHVNHPRELCQALSHALLPLRQAGITLLNQAVLLRGVNDHADTLCRLSEQLFASGILPYYLHELDRVQGAAHFEVPPGTALQLEQAVRARLPGYLAPRLVREVAGADAKLPSRELAAS